MIQTTQTYPFHNFLKSIFCLNLRFKGSYFISTISKLGTTCQLLITLINMLNYPCLNKLLFCNQIVYSIFFLASGILLAFLTLRLIYLRNDSLNFRKLTIILFVMTIKRTPNPHVNGDSFM